MTRTYSAGRSRHAAVLTAIVAFHLGMFLLIAAGLGPRIIGLIGDEDPPPVTLLPEQPDPIERSAPEDPGPLDFVVSVEPKPDLVIPVFPNEPAPTLSQEPGTAAAGAGADHERARSERVAPRLKGRNERLAALIDSCYPAGSRRAGEEGRAIVHLVIGGRGRVNSWRLAGSTGYARLDAAVRCIIDRLEFVPGRQDGRAVEAEAQLPIVFRLD